MLTSSGDPGSRRLLVVLAAAVVALTGCVGAPPVVEQPAPDMEEVAADLVDWFAQQESVVSTEVEMFSDSFDDLEITVVLEADTSSDDIRELSAHVGEAPAPGNGRVWLEFQSGEFVWGHVAGSDPSAEVATVTWLRSDPRVIGGDIALFQSTGYTEDDAFAVMADFHAAMQAEGIQARLMIQAPPVGVEIPRSTRIGLGVDKPYPTDLVESIRAFQVAHPGTWAWLTHLEGSYGLALRLGMPAGDLTAARDAVAAAFDGRFPAGGLALVVGVVSGTLEQYTAERIAFAARAAALPGVTEVNITDPDLVAAVTADAAGWSALFDIPKPTPEVVTRFTYRHPVTEIHVTAYGVTPDGPTRAAAAALGGSPSLESVWIGSGRMLLGLRDEVTPDDMAPIVATIVASGAAPTVALGIRIDGNTLIATVTDGVADVSNPGIRDELSEAFVAAWQAQTGF